MSCTACTKSVLSIFLREVAGVDLYPVCRLPIRQLRTFKHLSRSQAAGYSTAAAVQTSRAAEHSNIIFELPKPSPVDATHHQTEKLNARRSRITRQTSHNYRLTQWKRSAHQAKEDEPPEPKSMAHEERLQRWKAQNRDGSPEISDDTGTKGEIHQESVVEERKRTSVEDHNASSRSSPASIASAAQPKPVRTSKAPSSETRPRKQDPNPSRTKPPDYQPREREPWQLQKAALASKLAGDSWNPQRKLSPDALEGIRALHAQYPEQFPTAVLAQHFKISPEAIRRILKSKWKASGEEAEDRRERWEKRGARIWEALVEKGEHAPRKWREMGIGAGGPRKGRREWLEGVRERDEREGRERPGVVVPKRAPVIATKWEGDGEQVGLGIGSERVDVH